MDICPECKEQPYDDSGLPPFAVALRLPGTVVHSEDCPTLPRLSPEAQEKLNADLAEIARCRRAAEASARNYVLH